MNKPATILRSASDTKARFTTAEFLRMGQAGAFDDMKVELVDGELERLNTPMSAHGARQAQIVIRLGRVVAERLLIGEVGIDLGNDSVLGCDAAVLNAPIQGHRLLMPEDVALIVEVAETTLSRDIGLKRIKYAEAGIPIYWVIDASRSVVHVFADPIDGEYAQVNTVRFGEPLAVPATDATITLD